MKNIVPLKYIDSNGESLFWLSNIPNEQYLSNDIPMRFEFEQWFVW